MEKNIIIAADTRIDPIIEIGTEIDPRHFYHDVDRYGLKWMELDGWSKRMLERICNDSYTMFAYELRSMAAAMAIVSTKPVLYRNPFTRFLVYHKSMAARWLIILLETYINEGEYIWIRRNRFSEVKNLLESNSCSHPLIDYLENRIDAAIMNHYIGWDLVSVMVDKFADISREDWHNKGKKDVDKAEIIQLY